LGIFLWSNSILFLEFMYLRFITNYFDEYGKESTGVFQCLGYLIRSESTYDYDKEKLEEIRVWFNTYLEKPDRFNKQSRKNGKNVALSWFKNTAVDHIRNMYDLVSIFENYDFRIQVIKKEKIGRIIFQDEYQAVAIPYNKQKSKVK